MSRTPHDALFKAAFKDPAHAAALLVAVLPGGLRRAIAWQTLRPCGTNIVNPRLRQHYNDLLFRADFAELEGPVLLLLEHQSSVDAAMARRVLAYISRIWSTSDVPTVPPVLAVVFSHDASGWTAPVSVRDLVVPHPDLIPGLANFLPDFSIHVVDLITLSNDDLMGCGLPPFPLLALWLLRDARNSERLLANFPHWVATFATILGEPGGARALTMLLHYIFLVAGEDIFDQLHETILAHLPTAKATLMTIAESLHQKGREEGSRTLLTRLLEQRFGQLDPQHRELLANADQDQLERIAAVLLSASSPAAVFQ